MDKLIKIETFNPYEKQFPNRKVITLDTLILIKLLRNEGFDVKILPDDNRPIEYIFRKGLKEIFSDPITMFIINLPVALIINIISNYIQKALDSNAEKEINVNKNSIIIIDGGKQKIYNYLGNTLSKNDIIKRQKGINKNIKEFEKALKAKSPNNLPPTPVFYEHKPKIVGWCYMKYNNHGIFIEKGVITEPKIRKKIASGTIKGLSITGIATKTECSICKSDFVQCNHLTTQDEHVTNTILKADVVEISLVKTPINKECIVSFQ